MAWSGISRSVVRTSVTNRENNQSYKGKHQKTADMEQDIQSKIKAAAAYWSSDFLVRKLEEILVKEDVVDMLSTRLGDELLEELEKACPELKDDGLLHGELNSRALLKQAQDVIKTNEAALVAHDYLLYEELLEAVKTIREDLVWAHSIAGKGVLEIDRWIRMFRPRLVSQWPESIILVGRNMMDDDPCNIIIGGDLKDAKEEDVIGFVKDNNPPVEPFFLFSTEH